VARFGSGLSSCHHRHQAWTISLTLPDRHSRPTAAMLATAIERLYLPPNGHLPLTCSVLGSSAPSRMPL
jgi:hypothetical protein